MAILTRYKKEEQWIFLIQLGIFFSDGLVLCCRALTYRQGSKMVNNEISLAKSYNNLKEALKNEHKDLLVINNVVNKMNEHLEGETLAIK